MGQCDDLSITHRPVRLEHWLCWPIIHGTVWWFVYDPWAFLVAWWIRLCTFSSSINTDIICLLTPNILLLESYHNNHILTIHLCHIIHRLVIWNDRSSLHMIHGLVAIPHWFMDYRMFWSMLQFHWFMDYSVSWIRMDFMWSMDRFNGLARNEDGS